MYEMQCFRIPNLSTRDLFWFLFFCSFLLSFWLTLLFFWVGGEFLGPDGFEETSEYFAETEKEKDCIRRFAIILRLFNDRFLCCFIFSRCIIALIPFYFFFLRFKVGVLFFALTYEEYRYNGNWFFFCARVSLSIFFNDFSIKLIH